MADGKVLGRIAELANRPIFKMMAKAAAAAVRERAEENGATIRATPALEAEIATNLASNPVVVNETNSETPRSSRTATGAVHAIIGSLGSLLIGVAEIVGAAPLIQPEWLGYVFALIGATGTGGGLFALWGRFKEGLPPMTRKWYNPFSYFAPAKVTDTVA